MMLPASSLAPSFVSVEAFYFIISVAHPYTVFQKNMTKSSTVS